jgi:FkbM family methyltransferase
MSFEAPVTGGPYATVLDVGAFRGEFALSCLRAWHETKVLSFEPLEPEPRKVTRRYTRRWSWFKVALVAREGGGQATMYRNEFIPSSSILPMAELHREAFPYTRQTEPVKVGTAALDEFFEMVEAPALLKIDVQGYELEVLKGATEVLTLCEAVIAEVNHEELYAGAASPKAMSDFVEAAGFEWQGTLDELYHPAREKMLLQSDELWVRA